MILGKKRIDELRKEVDAATNKLKTAEEKLKDIEQRWKPEIQDLVKKISTKFEEYMLRLGLEGQVDLFDPTDYEKWGIHIKVNE